MFNRKKIQALFSLANLLIIFVVFLFLYIKSDLPAQNELLRRHDKTDLAKKFFDLNISEDESDLEDDYEGFRSIYKSFTASVQHHGQPYFVNSNGIPQALLMVCCKTGKRHITYRNLRI